MVSFSDPSFQERAKMAAKAKQSALKKLKAKPPISAEALAERKTARLEREQAVGKTREEKRAAVEQLRTERKAAKKQATPEAAPESTEAEKKAARDARYAARKKRKK